VGDNTSDELVDSKEIPADKTTAIQVANKYSVNSMGIDLNIGTRVSSAELRQKRFDRNLRIAGIRLKPVVK
jgi:hypothetical protein